MTSSYAACADHVHRLDAAVRQLETLAQALQLPPLARRDWFEILDRKLLPQLTDDAFLVVAVVGGTNIGKSVIFNHLAGCHASATSPFASGTKHPVCLVPTGFEQRHDLDSIFRGFSLHAWATSEAALEDHAEHRLFWRTSAATPSNLLILDTPDIDGDVRVNWERAANIRRCADVLVAVLTQQKYNDAAVKQFFRKAADEDKAVLIVFNQVLLPDDEPFWPTWLRTFCQETGVRPEFVYIVPSDRRAAEENQLPFYVREWSTPETDSASGRRESAGSSEVDAIPTGRLTPPARQQRCNEQHSLKDDLSSLHFSSIKLRSLRGALRQVLQPETGLPAYLTEIERRSAEFASASELLATHQLAEIDDWPAIPTPVVVNEIRHWWQQQREGWTKTIHDSYNTLGRWIAKPFTVVRDHWQGERQPPLEQYRRREWQTILDAVEKVYDRLRWFSDLGNPLLQPRIERLLAGKSRVEMLELLKTRHDLTDLAAEVCDLVTAEMEAFRAESPHVFQYMKWLDQGAAAVRPVTSIALFVTGFGPAGDAVGHLAANTAIQSAVHLAGDITGGTVAAALGETAISNTASTGVGMLEARFRRLHARFTAQRAGWLARMLKDHLLGSLPEEFQAATSVPQSEVFRTVRETIQVLRKELPIAECPVPSVSDLPATLHADSALLGTGH